ncbi:MAG: DNA primase [Flavobacteriaceae bacterium]|nr:MAG: DNA primase [Flavobacteriaceae bacterium]
MISKNTIDKVFETARVEEVIGEFVQLKKSGSSFKGLSPFSEERTPSFMVSPVKGIWKDFSTGKGGNTISFLMEHEHYTYPEAIKWLARKYNIEIEETEQTDAQKHQNDERENMFVVSEYAKEYFHNVLLEDNEGKAIGLSYFKERGFTDATIKKFQLGYSLNEWHAFTDEAENKGYAIKYLESTGLTIVKENPKNPSQPRKFDRFKGRVLFPIHSMSGRVLGFGGRILTNDKKAAKYLNSPESDIYHKSKILYGLFHAKQQIAREDNCFLVEGYTDVISFHQAGIENVVASSGTALTPDQIRLVNRLTKNITILFDGDAAGIRASLRGIDLILEQGMNVKVMTFPDGDDPDSFSKKVSPEELKTYLAENSQDFIKFKVSLLLEEAQSDPVKKAGLIREIVTSISKIPDNIQQEVYLQECSRIMDISESVLFSALAQLNSKEDNNASKSGHSQGQPMMAAVKDDKPRVKINEIRKYEFLIIKILLLYGNLEVDFIDLVEDEEKSRPNRKVTKKEEFTNTVSNEIYLSLQDDEIEFTDPVFKDIYFDIIHQMNQKQPVSINQFVNHPDPAISGIVTDVLMDDDKYTLSNWAAKEVIVKPKEKSLSKHVLDTIYNLRRVLIVEKIKEIAEGDWKDEDRLEKMELIMNYTKLKILISDRLYRVV